MRRFALPVYDALPRMGPGEWSASSKRSKLLERLIDDIKRSAERGSRREMATNTFDLQGDFRGGVTKI